MIRSIVRAGGRAMLAALALSASLWAGAGEAGAQRIQGWDQNRPAGAAGRFDYYVLAMSWSPTYCAEQRDPGDDQQCRPRSNRPYSFVLHGLWPQFERGYPEFCPTRDRPFVPQSVIDRMMDVMPARGLIIHQYRKHGTCSGLEPGAYFDAARRLFQKIKIPTRFVNTERDQVVERRTVIDEFVAANPGLKPEHMAVTCGGTGNRLREVRVCFTREGEPRACGSNEDANKLCRSPRVYIPPVRYVAGGGSGGRRERAPARPDTGKEILPGPVVPPGVRNL